MRYVKSILVLFSLGSCFSNAQPLSQPIADDDGGGVPEQTLIQRLVSGTYEEAPLCRGRIDGNLNPEEAYQCNVQKRLMDDFDWSWEESELFELEDGSSYTRRQFEMFRECFYGNPWEKSMFRFTRMHYVNKYKYAYIKEPLEKMKVWLRNPVFAIWYVYHRMERKVPTGESLSQKVNEALIEALRNTPVAAVATDDPAPVWVKMFFTYKFWREKLRIDRLIDVTPEQYAAMNDQQKKDVLAAITQDFQSIREEEQRTQVVHSYLSDIIQSVVNDFFSLETLHQYIMQDLIRSTPQWRLRDQNLRTVRATYSGEDARREREMWQQDARAFLDGNPRIEVNFRETTVPLLAMSSTPTHVVLDFAHECMHKKSHVEEGESGLFMTEGCACRVEIPKVLTDVAFSALQDTELVRALRDSRDPDKLIARINVRYFASIMAEEIDFGGSAGKKRAYNFKSWRDSLVPMLTPLSMSEDETSIPSRTDHPIKFTFYRLGYAGYTQTKTIPANLYHELLAEFGLMTFLYQNKLGSEIRTAEGGYEVVPWIRDPVYNFVHDEYPGVQNLRVDVPALMFGDQTVMESVLGTTDAVRFQSR